MSQDQFFRDKRSATARLDKAVNEFHRLTGTMPGNDHRQHGSAMREAHLRARAEMIEAWKK